MGESDCQSSREGEASSSLKKVLEHLDSGKFTRNVQPKCVPRTVDYIDDNEVPYIINWWDENNRTEKNINVEWLRVWSRPRFKERDLPPTGKLNEKTEENKNSKVDADLPSICEIDIQLTKKIIKKFIDEEKNFKKSVRSQNMYNCEYLPLVKSSGKKFFRFFYVDAVENHFKDYSTVYLFGKTYCIRSGEYKSCCVIVQPLKRKLYVQVRDTFLAENMEEDISIKQLEIVKEFYDIALKPLKINDFNYRFVKKKILGMTEVEDSMLMEIEYSAQYCMLHDNIEGSTFSKVYGSKSNCFENFILEKKLKGPSWLDVFYHEKPIKRNTWCCFEITCSPDDIGLVDFSLSQQVPPLILFSMFVGSAHHTKNSDSEISMISWTVRDYYISENHGDFGVKSYCAFVAPAEQQFEPELEEFNSFGRTFVKKLSSEKELLVYFLNEFHQIDPDILVGYDFQSHNIHHMVNRLIALSIKNVVKFGRFRGTPNHGNLRNVLFSGRTICDIKNLVPELISSKCKELDGLYEKFINVSKDERSPESIYYSESREKLLEAVVRTTNESIYLMQLASNTYVVSLALRLTNICGNVLSQTFSFGVLKRTEYLLAHAFHEGGFVLPDKKFRKNKNEKELGGSDAEPKVELIQGGLVLEPILGIYDNYVLLMDFRSLYPSIIHEYNLCLSHGASETTHSSLGILPHLMHQFMRQRKIIKDDMKNLDENCSSYYCHMVNQSVLKLSANSIYGCLGSTFSRFYSPHIAGEITAKGREILKNSMNILQSKGFTIIYGDTDSLMINTRSIDLKAVQELSEQIKEMINKQFSTIQIDVDCIFKHLLLIAKKKYCGIAVTEEMGTIKYKTVLKGLDISRDDLPDYVCKVGRNTVECILSDSILKDKISKLKELLVGIREDLKNNKVPLKSLAVTKYLTQEPNSNVQNKAPHMKVAIRCNRNSILNFRKGDAVSYVVCLSGEAYHIKELNNNSNLKIDINYYLGKLIYPMISRICKTIADDIDLDLKKLLNIPVEKKRNFEGILFEYKAPFIFNCVQCEQKNEIYPVHEQDEFPFIKCQNEQCTFSPLKNPKYLLNQLRLTIKNFIIQYYKYEIKCDNKICDYKACGGPLNAIIKKRCPSCSCGKIKQVFDEKDLYLQMEYIKSIFRNVNDSSEQEVRDVSNELLQVIDEYKLSLAFNTINLTDLFYQF